VTRRFAENLAGLPSVNHVVAIELRDAIGRIVGKIENKSGSAGSVKVYAFLAGKWGRINQIAASEGLDIYAEHTEDARLHPGKHPNIDRLYDVVRNCRVLEVEIVEAQ
jgi:hypothetical protein